MSSFVEDVPPFDSIQEQPKQTVRKRAITVDFTTTTFSGLTPLSEISREDIFGPTDESNWVVPGKLIAGAFPGYINDIENLASLVKILNCGVTKFVCMQEEYDPEAKEADWKTTAYRQNPILRPYFADVQ